MFIFSFVMSILEGLLYIFIGKIFCYHWEDLVYTITGRQVEEDIKNNKKYIQGIFSVQNVGVVLIFIGIATMVTAVVTLIVAGNMSRGNVRFNF